MLIIYFCENCNSKRYFTSIKSDIVNCVNCNIPMITQKTNIASEVKSTEDSRFFGDEAIYNTVGSRITEKRSKHFTSK